MSLREYSLAGPRPPVDAHGAARRGSSACGDQGCVGPFTNQNHRRGDGIVYGDCMECGRRVRLEASARGFESLGQVVEAIMPPPNTR
ncbi:MAG: hypothetical protein KY464_14890 [Gemmatimonadetes bacterium]|nr:hypothetical protein [Gemmatimonadota bacterium]